MPAVPLNAALLLCSSLSETLQMVVVLPFLWGVPPEHENLRSAWIALLVTCSRMHLARLAVHLPCDADCRCYDIAGTP